MAKDQSSVTPHPDTVPARAFFSSGPCAKRPGWDFEHVFRHALIGRSHRSMPAVKQQREMVSLMRELLGLPEDYVIGMIGGSATGAMEAAMWNLLGPRPVSAIVCDAFSKYWAHDVEVHLKCTTIRHEAPYGQLPELNSVAPEHDIVFLWNATTSGVILPNADWIHDDRSGLTICDATSAAFAVPLPWEKLDVTAFSWQKALGGEGGYGMLVLSPRALKRLQDHPPQRAIPQNYRFWDDGRLALNWELGRPINTISLMALADVLDALHWVKREGGVSAMQSRVVENAKVLDTWVQNTPWASYLVEDASLRSPISVTLKLQDNHKVAAMLMLLERYEAGFDLGHFSEAPSGLRIWCGPTVAADDLVALLPWLEWSYHNS